MQVGIAGASGYAGAELLRLCAGHGELDVVVAGADSQAGQPVAALYPSLAGAYPSLEFSKAGVDELAGLDVVFLALPHGESQEVAPGLVGRVEVLVDLSADFRLRDAQAYPRWYGHAHAAPDLLGRFAYGLPELFRSELTESRLVAAPGCYPTAAALALAPLVRAGAIETTRGHRRRRQRRVGGGPEAGPRHPVQHRRRGLHGVRAAATTATPPRSNRRSGAQVLFTPHLAPMNRGILATCYARPRRRARHRGRLGDPA